LVAVVVVSYKSWPDVQRLVGVLSTCPEVESKVCEVLVVDNATPGAVPADLARDRPGVRLITRRENGGFAAGVNSGWRATRAPWILVLNPDVVVGAEFLRQVAERAARYEADLVAAPGLVGFGLLNPDGSRQPSVGEFPTLWRTLRGQFIPRSRRKYQAGWQTRPGPVPWVTGACVLISARLLDLLGGLDEDFFLYYEEVAFCRTARRLGWQVDHDPAVTAVHLHPLQNRTVSPLIRIITRHSQLLYFRKHSPRWEFLVLSVVVSLESAACAAWSRVCGRSDQARAWASIGALARQFRAGMEPRGRQVLRMAEDTLSPGAGWSSPDPAADHSVTVSNAGHAGSQRPFEQDTAA
jgi:GT2 family glycosyltransferase